MKIHSSPGGTFPVSRIALAVLVSLAVHVQAEQKSAKVEDRVNSILSQMTLDEKLSYISGTGFPNPIGAFNIKPIARLGLPTIYGIDGSVGIVGQGVPPGTRYPSGQLLSATWNPDRAFDEGVAQGREGRARGVHRILGPGVNFYRTALYGRSFEYMTGEDPFLGAVLVAAEVTGIQSQGVMATTKHYVANDAEVNRFFVNSVVDERTLREIYLPPFEAAVKLANTAAIMGAFNKVNGDFASDKVNGDFACESLFLDTQVLKEDWGFRGFIESDFGAIHDGLKAAKAGMDLDMPGGTFTRMTPEKLLPAIGEINLDDKVRRILRGIISYGFLDRPQLDPSIPDPKSKEVATKVAREGIVLLENKGNFLPLDKHAIRRIAVIGANAQGEPPSGGGSAAVPPSLDFISEIDGIKSQAKRATVDYIAACVPDPSTAVWQTGQGSAGLVGQYFNSSDLSGSPVATRIDTQLNFASFNATNVPVSDFRSFSGIWTGKVTPTITGDHVFKVSSGGNVRLFVKVSGVDQKVLDDTSPVGTPDTPISAAPPFVPISGKIKLQAGVAYDIRLEAVNLGTTRLFAAAGLQVSWASLKPPPLADYDAVVLAVGGNEQYDGEGHDRSFRLPEFQDDLIQNAAVLNPRTIVVLHGGGGFDVQAWISQVPALLHAWFIGGYGGQALAEILFGEVNPSGKLPITMEKRVQDNPAFATFPINDPNAPEIKYSEGLFVGYRGYEKNRIEPQYPFGYGLSYTKFQYSDLEINPFVLKKNVLKKDDGLVRVSFRVTNTGKRDGAEIAQLYVAPPVHPTVVRPLKELKGFQKIDLQPGKSKKVTIILDGRSLAYYNVNAGRWDVAPGAYRILVGSSSEDIRLQGGLENLFSSSLSVLDSTPVPGAKRVAQDLLSTGENARTEAPAPGTRTLTVNNGRGSGHHVAGTFVTVTADAPPAGQQFAGWSGDTEILANPSVTTTTATMPSIDVTITATYAGALSSEQSK
jgi:beta-glucosidase